MTARVSAASSFISAVTHVVRAPGGFAIRFGVASYEDDIISVGKERTSRVAADEAAGARDRDPGHSIDTVVAGRRRPLGALPRS